MNHKVSQSCDRLLAWVLAEDFCGWDLFDGLNSRLFQATSLARSPLCRLAWIQFFKTSPVNFRVIAKVPKGLGLFASALLRLGRKSDAEALLLRLLNLTTKGYCGTSWGYNFDWQARAFYVPKGKPNVVTTVFVAQAFLDVYERTGCEKWLRPARDAAAFIVKHLVLEPGPCFG